jgi:hypothetical protein
MNRKKLVHKKAKAKENKWHIIFLNNSMRCGKMKKTQKNE